VGNAERVLFGIDINTRSPGVRAQAVRVLNRPEVVATGEQMHPRIPDLLERAEMRQDFFENSQQAVRDFLVAFDSRDLRVGRKSQRQGISGFDEDQILAFPGGGGLS